MIKLLYFSDFKMLSDTSKVPNHKCIFFIKVKKKYNIFNEVILKESISDDDFSMYDSLTGSEKETAVKETSSRTL